MDNKEIYIIGAGTYGEAIYELALLCGFNPVGYFDDDEAKKGKIVMGIPVLGPFNRDRFDPVNKNFAVAIGNNSIRKSKMEQLLNFKAYVPSLIHPTAIISPYAKIDKIGCYVHANTYLWTKVLIEKYSIVSPCVMIAHHTRLSEGTFISAGSNIGAGINVSKMAFVGIGSTIMTGVKCIGEYVTIGAGSVVIKDVPDYAVVVGNPSKIIKYNSIV